MNDDRYHAVFSVEASQFLIETAPTNLPELEAGAQNRTGYIADDGEIALSDENEQDK